MTRRVVAAVVLVGVLSIAGQAAAATARIDGGRGAKPFVWFHASRSPSVHGPCFNTWFADVQPRYGLRVVHRRVRALISCVTSAVGFPGGIRSMTCIASRESGLWPWASSPGGGYAGLMQLSRRYWPAWLRAVPARWFIRRPPITNPRANLLTAAMLAHRAGLSPWGGPC